MGLIWWEFGVELKGTLVENRLVATGDCQWSTGREYKLVIWPVVS